MRSNRLLLTLCTSVLLSVPALAGTYTSVVVYGDSLSDNGNLFAATGFPPAPYFDGRRSNGPVAVEYLAASLGVPLLDFAWIGATTGVGNFGDNGTTTSFGFAGLPGMTTVYNNTAAIVPTQLSALFVVWGGANDLLAPSPLDTTPDAIVARAIADEVAIVQGLISQGATHILVPGMPDVGLTPYFQSLGPLAAAGASTLTDAFNAGLRAALPPGVLYFDAAALLRNMTANPAAFGFTNVTDPCFTGTTLCANPDQYLFFDDFHPTTATHLFVGEGLYAVAVPEPSALLLAGAGLALLLAARRRA